MNYSAHVFFKYNLKGQLKINDFGETLCILLNYFYIFFYDSNPTQLLNRNGRVMECIFLKFYKKQYDWYSILSFMLPNLKYLKPKINLKNLFY